jgi:hypothetical protein
LNWGNTFAYVLVVEQVVAAALYASQGHYWKAANFFFGAGIVYTIIRM